MGILATVCTVVWAAAWLGGIVFLGIYDPTIMGIVLAGSYVAGMLYWYLDIKHAAHVFRHSNEAPHRTVGVRSIRVPGSVAYRCYYPSEEKLCCRQEGWFYEGVHWFSMGYLNLLTKGYINPDGCVAACLLCIIKFGVYLVPLGWIKVPDLYKDVSIAEPLSNSKQKGYPLIVFSHGLIATGEEHSLVLTEIARHGYVVAALTHQDGSAPRARKEDGSNLWFLLPQDHEVLDQCTDVTCEFPKHTDGDLEFWNNEAVSKFAKFREKQVVRRAKEFNMVKRHILEFGPKEVVDGIDKSRVIAAGFSYGATTAALAAASLPDEYCGAVLWDGWFHIDGIDYPRLVHKHGLQHPSLLVDSSQYGDNHPYAEAVKRLLGKTKNQRTLSLSLPESTHEHFVDLPFWVPSGSLCMCGGPKNKSARATVAATTTATKTRTHRASARKTKPSSPGHLANLITLRDQTLEFLESLDPISVDLERRMSGENKTNREGGKEETVDVKLAETKAPHHHAIDEFPALD
mmetsp:Transcript_31282/g.60377  ORF Transcript_31282/g.60377 Transcript_31282/m.60377 type:complete len:515 (+) Transcript_31282:65-1609(+)|eukprot:CAMPEP_0167790018 /NCGR_PEP_ID=MMETSP0111_2-20121227/11054_1 /TAXON_ID=91324 /ORGANISM="Lotharella globosa, Strain CCCM811" /LENGTH=514 /DNA_ID=CAMNT_0007682343 /DNA_START=17 /DNA_END=1561 /DNA_ORIENTATION=+